MLKLRLSALEHSELLQKHLRGTDSYPTLAKTQQRSLAHPGKRKWHYEQDLAEQIEQAGLALPILEYAFAKPERKFRADLCWPSLKLIVEIEGAVHRIKARYKTDIERRQWCFLHDWRILPILPEQVKNGEALVLVEQALNNSNLSA